MSSSLYRSADEVDETGSADTFSGRPVDHSGRLARAALVAAARGFPVFPLWPGSKRPIEKGWQFRATTERSIILERWRALPYNIGIACGNGLYVIDLDSGRGQTPPPGWAGASHGREVLARVAAAAGQCAPGPTYRVLTPSGGEHLYFAAPRNPPLRNTAGRLGWRVDTRGSGGFVVGAGSVLPTGIYRLVDDTPPAPLPE